MQENIEVILNDDGTLYINFWDYAHGNDVIGEMKSINDTGITVNGHIITFNDFLKKIKENVDKRTI
jgi:hypothetical protein